VPPTFLADARSGRPPKSRSVQVAMSQTGVVENAGEAVMRRNLLGRLLQSSMSENRKHAFSQRRVLRWKLNNIFLVTDTCFCSQK
jgi:hypothetical protein